MHGKLEKHQWWSMLCEGTRSGLEPDTKVTTTTLQTGKHKRWLVTINHMSCHEHWVTKPEISSKTNTETYFKTKYFRDRYRDFLSRQNVFWDRYRFFFWERIFLRLSLILLFFGTGTETFFRPNFSRPRLRLFSRLIFLRPRLRLQNQRLIMKLFLIWLQIQALAEHLHRYGYLYVVTWICQSSMYHLPFAKKGKLKFDQDSKVCWSFCFELKMLNE